MSARSTVTPAKMPLLGKVALEEAFQLPRLQHEEDVGAKNIGLYINPSRAKEYSSGIVNIEDRLVEARKTGVGYTICSLTIPGVQGERDPQKAEAFATESNDWIYSQIKNHPTELGAFAAISMHNPAQAAQELRRAVTGYGFHGAMVNNWQCAYKDNGKETLLLYDGPEYDVFWSALEELDVPLYIHPSKPEGAIYDLLYKDRPYLQGPPSSFAIDVSTHVLGLITNGVFDRHPQAQIIIGHMAERMPFDFDRTHRWLEQVEKPLGMPGKKTLYEVFQNNIWLTTSGQFSTMVLQFCVNLVGADRILYSVDYPYEVYADASEWFDNVDLNTRDKLKIARENAKKLLKLHEYKDANAPYHQ